MIVVKNITKTFGAHKAVDDISFSVKEGENLVFLGTSGCGKTTLLKMINRLIEPDSGGIWIAGQKIEDQRPEELRKKIGTFFRTPVCFPITRSKKISASCPVFSAGIKERLPPGRLTCWKSSTCRPINTGPLIPMS
jgi:ABC-type proline/glycine betaine transport system ATPase subunit